MFRRAQRACVDFAVLPLVLFSAWGGPCLGQTLASSSAQPADTGSLSLPRVAGDPVKLSFLFMGCNRIQHSDWKKIPSARELVRENKRNSQDRVDAFPVNGGSGVAASPT